MHAESAFDPWAFSRAGAIGSMRLMPALAVEMGVVDPFDPRQNTMQARDIYDSSSNCIAATTS